jgi:hypothetical protein
MNIKEHVMYLAIACGLAACTTTAPAPSDEEQQPDLTMAVPAELTLPPATNAEECPGDINCPPQFSCEPWFDRDCGDEFCRTPGAQCNAQPSTFIRVSHFSRCFDTVGNMCVAVAQGRRLVHCGC